MPTLIVDQPNRRFGGRVTGKVLIGRLPTNGVPLIDSSVSRLHAWIDRNGNGHHFVADTGSLTGTWVNGAAITKRRDLKHGDLIKVGKTQITFSEDETLPEGVEIADLAGSAPIENVEEAGVLFECPCGAPAWYKASAIGHNHQCRQCGRTVRIPDRSNAMAAEVSAPPVIEPGMPEAGEPFHATDPSNPLLIHSPGMGETPAPVEEHGLADSGIHNAINADSPAESPVDVYAKSDDLTLDEMISPGAGLELLEAPAPPAEAEPIWEPEPAPVKPPLFERRAPVMETVERLPDDNVLELGPADASPALDATLCSVCHNVIAADESQTSCPSCGLTFHAECWNENLGCSAYGCPQVNALKPEEPVETQPVEDPEFLSPPTQSEEDPGFPWEFVFLFVSVIGTLLGALSFGVPAMIGFLGSLIYVLAFQDSRRRRGVAWVAVMVCLVGIAVGIYLSHRYWHGWPPIGPWAHQAAATKPAGARR